MIKHLLLGGCVATLAALCSCGQPGPGDAGGGQPSALVIPTVSVPTGHPMVISVPDGAQARAHLAASLVGQAWQHPAMAEWYQATMRWMAENADQQGEPKIDRFYTDLRSLLFMGGRKGRQSYIISQFDLGDYADGFIADVNPNGRMEAIDPLPPGAKAGLSHYDEQLIQYDSTIVFTEDVEEPVALQVLPDLAGWDAHARIDVPGMLQTMRIGAPVALPYRTIEVFYRVLASGSEELWVFDGPPTHSATVETALLERVPADCDLVLASGLDGKSLWNDGIAPLFDATGRDGKRAREELGQMFAALGVEQSPMAIVGQIQGTMVFALKEGSGALPIPQALLALPRAEHLDDLIAKLLAMIERLPPGEGEQLSIPVPGLPLAITILRHERHWVASTSDSMLTTWKTGGSGWPATPTGQAAIAAGGDQPLFIGGLDAPAMIKRWSERMAAQIDQEQDHQVDFAAIGASLATTAGPNWMAITSHDGKAIARFGGPVGGPATWGLLALLAEIGDDLLREARPYLQAEIGVGGEAKAAFQTLRSGIFTAQIQYQAGGYSDLNGDGVGSYGFLPQLSGAKPADVAGKTDIRLQLIGAHYGEGLPIAGYHYKIFLPDGNGGGLSTETPDLPSALAAVEAMAETYWIAYAWPAAGISAQRPILCITQDGEVFGSTDATITTPPTWSAGLADGATVTDSSQLAWELFDMDQDRYVRSPARQLERLIERTIEAYATGR